MSRTEKTIQTEQGQKGTIIVAEIMWLLVQHFISVVASKITILDPRYLVIEKAQKRNVPAVHTLGLPKVASIGYKILCTTRAENVVTSVD